MVLSRPFGKRFGVAIYSDHARVASVVHLVALSDPLTIVGRIALIIVNAVDSEVVCVTMRLGPVEK